MIQISYAAENVRTGRGVHLRPYAEYITASIVKVNILAALAVTEPEPWPEHDANRILRASSNEFTSEIWTLMGGGEWLEKANRILGLETTIPAPDSRWGLTRTTATDQLRLIGTLFDTNSPVPALPRLSITHHMANVNTDQRWGISILGRPFWVKNGWVPLSRDWRNWTLNSIGRSGDLHLAVLSSGHRNYSEESRGVVAAAALQAADRVRTTRHIVKPGDTLSQIALYYGVTLRQISEANPHITNLNRIFPGEEIAIPE